MNCPESYIKNVYKTLWSTSDAPVEGVTPFAQQPEHTIWTFQAELREIQDALSPRGASPPWSTPFPSAAPGGSSAA